MIEITVPNLPESVADATLTAWHKQAGDVVSKDENLIDLETDKVMLEVPAPHSGVLVKLLKQNGEIVKSGDVLALLETEQVTQNSNDTNASETNSAAQTAALSPAVRRLVNEKHLDPTAIQGTGKSGRITKTDVLDYLNKAESVSPDPTGFKNLSGLNNVLSETAKQESQSVLNEAKNTDYSAPTASNLRPEQRVSMTRLRAKVAERLLEAQRNAAMLTTFNEVNMQAVMDLRQQYKTRFEQKHQIKLGLMSFFVKAAIEGLKRFPMVNASIDGNDIIYHGYYDLGIAVSTDRGLIVPVLRDADQLDFAGIEKSIVEFSTKARAGTISYEDLSGGTFTITNGGIFGSMLSTPILNPPQCAILGMHAIKERPVVENGQIVIRPMMYLALSYDHRLIDGREAVQFLVTIKECLEAPAHLLLNI
jgi:2-oxoglutarate dehydrogenase E2 component (dihydrolipoamide succinyltransferase)